MVPILLIFIGLIIYKSNLSEAKPVPEIVNLGNTINGQLNNLTRDNAGGLYNNFSTYLKSLKDINDLIWSKDGEIVIKGMKIFDDLEEAGGPPHLIDDLDYKLLAEKLNWKDSEVEHVKSVVSETKLLWEAVKDRANRLRIGTWGVDSKVEDETLSPGQEDSDGDLH